MAKSGLKPVVAIYSTFMQRAFDQVFQEVALQELPVIFCMDRAGLVGGDGAVHHGFADIAFMRVFPNMICLAPSDEPELAAALRFALAQNQAVAIRYPRANVPEPAEECPPFELGQSRVVRTGRDATILAYGVSVDSAVDAASMLAAQDVMVKVVNARFAKPVDQQMVRTALSTEKPVITVEDHGVAGGFGSAVLETAQELGLPTDQLTRLGMPSDRFISQGSRSGQLAECGIDAAGIASAVLQALGSQSSVAQEDDAWLHTEAEHRSPHAGSAGRSRRPAGFTMNRDSER
jgi:1-deoxy-D-xylulose-5-phosphate synthase